MGILFYPDDWYKVDSMKMNHIPQSKHLFQICKVLFSVVLTKISFDLVSSMSLCVCRFKQSSPLFSASPFWKQVCFQQTHTIFGSVVLLMVSWGLYYSCAAQLTVSFNFLSSGWGKVEGPLRVLWLKKPFEGLRGRRCWDEKEENSSYVKRDHDFLTDLAPLIVDCLHSPFHDLTIHWKVLIIHSFKISQFVIYELRRRNNKQYVAVCHNTYSMLYDIKTIDFKFPYIYALYYRL